MMGADRKAKDRQAERIAQNLGMKNIEKLMTSKKSP
jgi:hypothetical protein